MPGSNAVQFVESLSLPAAQAIGQAAGHQGQPTPKRMQARECFHKLLHWLGNACCQS